MRHLVLFGLLLTAACSAPSPASDGGDPPRDASTPSDAGVNQEADAGRDAGAADAGVVDAGAMTVGPTWVYASGGSLITAFVVDFDAGVLVPWGTTQAGSGASFLAFSPSARRLYSVNETTTGQLSAFQLGTDGGLGLLNRVSSSGTGPAHLAVDPSGRWVLAANYGSGDVPVVAVSDAGLGATTDVERPGVQPHLVAFTPDDRFVFVPCKGSDLVAQFRFDGDAGTLTANTPPSVSTAAGAGPRHLVVHPSQKWAFLINELDSTLSSYAVTAQGTLSFIETHSTLPSGFVGSNTGAHIALHPSGRFVYGSNRGDDSVVGFRIDEQTGGLTLIGHTKTGGVRPRAFTLTPDGRWLIVANQGSNTLVAFQVDSLTGALTRLGEVATVSAPAFVGAVVWP